MKKIIVIFIFFVLSGCANIPLTTLFKFSTFDESDFVAIDGSQIKSKITISEPLTISEEKSKLSVNIENNLGSRQFTFPLVLVSEKKIPEEKGFFTSKPAQIEQVFKISEQGLVSLNDLQNSLSDDENNIGFSVNVDFNEEPELGDTVTFSIQLQLDEKDGFFTLVDNFELNFDESALKNKNQ